MVDRKTAYFKAATAMSSQRRADKFPLSSCSLPEATFPEAGGLFAETFRVHISQAELPLCLCFTTQASHLLPAAGATVRSRAEIAHLLLKAGFAGVLHCLDNECGNGGGIYRYILS